MTGTTFGRRTFVTMGLALLVGVGTVGSVDAEATSIKAAFKKGCEDTGGSFVENRDGSFQCNRGGGGTSIKCFPDNTCIIIASTVIDEGGTGGGPVGEVGPLDGVIDGSETPVVTPYALPGAANDAYRAQAGRTLKRSAAKGVLANDADGDRLTAHLLAGPAKGKLKLAADGSFVYVPQRGFRGTDRFTYVASDGQGGAAATVTIKVAG